MKEHQEKKKAKRQHHSSSKKIVHDALEVLLAEEQKQIYSWSYNLFYSSSIIFNTLTWLKGSNMVTVFSFTLWNDPDKRNKYEKVTEMIFSGTKYFQITI